MQTKQTPQKTITYPFENMKIKAQNNTFKNKMRKRKPQDPKTKPQAFKVLEDRNPEIKNEQTT